MADLQEATVLAQALRNAVACDARKRLIGVDQRHVWLTAHSSSQSGLEKEPAHPLSYAADYCHTGLR
jgi:hypothetical protein